MKLKTFVLAAALLATTTGTARAISLPDSSSVFCPATGGCGSGNALTVENTSTSGRSAIRGIASGTGSAVIGTAIQGSGLQGFSTTSSGVYGESSVGTGVWGRAFASGQPGLRGDGVDGPGVAASSTNGVGAQISSSGNDALQITTVGSLRSGIYVNHPGDGWALYATNHSSSRPAVFLYSSGLGGWALKTQGPAGGDQAWQVSSDIRLKANVVKNSYGLDTLKGIDTIVYTRKSDTSAAPRKHLGFSAQNLKPLVPEAVQVDPETGYYTVGYETVIPVTVKAIQEQQAIIAKLEARVKALEAAVTP